MPENSNYGKFITKPEYPGHYFVTEEEAQLRVRLGHQFCRSWGKRALMEEHALMEKPAAR